MSNSAQHKFSLVPEVTYGITPTNPVFKVKQILSTTLGLTKGQIESGAINPNRQVTDVRHGNRQIGGDIGFELAYGDFDDLMEAVFCGTWATNVLKPGITRRSFSMLRQFTDIGGGGNPFHLFKGCEFNTFSLSVAPESFIKCGFGIVGRELAVLGTAPSGSTYTDPAGKKSFDSYTGDILVDGVSVANVTELSLSIENGIEPRFVVFDDRTNQPKIGKTRVTGSLTLYFENSADIVAFNGAAKRSLEFSFIDLEGNEYQFEMPSILGSGGSPDVEGENDVTITVPFTAIYEQGAGTPDALILTRVPV